ncbi:MAG: OmpA family protein [Firmicutes bacterium]|nr:OmpA family protein [Bacillota bacterium]
MRNKRRRGGNDGISGAPAWMVTYGDLMSLLMCFFVLMFAFSRIDIIKFRQAIISLQGALGVLTGGPRPLNLGDLPAQKPPSESPEARERRNLMGVMRRFEGYLREKGLSNDVELKLDERGLVVSFMDKVLFDRGEATLKPDAKKVLIEVAGLIKKLPNDIRIEGHTCDLPIHSAKFPSNWELSTARATEVLRYLVESLRLPPERFSAMGYGQYHPKVPNTSERNRALNRRVDMVILTEKRRWEEPGKAPGPTTGGRPAAGGNSAKTVTVD